VKNIYVGNLPFSATEAEIRELFAQHGEVSRVKLIEDRETGRPRGFGFVEMASGGDEAIAALSGQDMGGRNLTVNEATPREPRRGGRGGGGGGGGGYRGGGGGGGGYRGGGDRR
jgi:cold-inducible RNA-binding protein